MPGTTDKTALYVYLPEQEYLARRWLRQVLGPRVKLARVEHRGVEVWKLNADHLLTLAGSVANAYGPTKMRLEVLHTRTCDSRCQDATETRAWECVCSCGGEFHGNNGSRNDWYPVGRTTLVRHDKTRIDQLIITDGQLETLRKVPRPARPAPIVLTPPPRTPHPVPVTPPTTTPARPTRTVVPAPAPTQAWFDDLQRGPAAGSPPGPAGPPPVPAPIPRRKPVTGSMMIAAVLLLAAVVGGIWLLADQHPSTSQQVIDQETIEPAPPPQEPVEPPPSPVQAVTPPPRLPAGCFPFQAGC
ncbi:hypothetical protein [Nocardia bovistercoris]|uniref:Uncharacterized protein n=1 Tax=Nocardia bovistercoris TaxID=2785916 RepID=A0A931IET8_9NOCA|nr:hypothetical protein [Nocardia bovistercoris]MBH0780387.1 hypothetical protein [Nocardia bovistercoris]